MPVEFFLQSGILFCYNIFEEISFVQTFAVNADRIDYMQHFQGSIVEAPKASIIMP
jgi:hypothetical protein